MGPSRLDKATSCAQNSPGLWRHPGTPNRDCDRPVLFFTRGRRCNTPGAHDASQGHGTIGGYMRRREFLKLTAGSAAATIAAGNLAVAQAALSKINHFVVLML